MGNDSLHRRRGQQQCPDAGRRGTRELQHHWRICPVRICLIVDVCDLIHAYRTYDFFFSPSAFAGILDACHRAHPMATRRLARESGPLRTPDSFMACHCAAARAAWHIPGDKGSKVKTRINHAEHVGGIFSRNRAELCRGLSKTTKSDTSCN